MKNAFLSAEGAGTIDIGLTQLPSFHARSCLNDGTYGTMGVGLGQASAAAVVHPDRLKVGSTEADTLLRIAAQIGTSTPDIPVLHLEIKTNDCRALERAIHAVLETRGKKTNGGGAEWFKVNREEIRSIYEFISQS